MVIDTSALIAILQNEPERGEFTSAIEQAESRVMSVVSLVEASMVIESRYGADGRRDLDLLVTKARIEFASVDADQAQIAREAFTRYGKGHHPARLNLGDCFSYALARALDEPLLCKGVDFRRTDIATHTGPCSQ